MSVCTMTRWWRPPCRTWGWKRRSSAAPFRSGRVVNGDAVLLLAARDMKTHVRLHNDTVVATTMSNMGLEAALQRGGIRMLRAPVGDKYVLEEMLKTGATLGGEQSGHILFRDMRSEEHTSELQ